MKPNYQNLYHQKTTGTTSGLTKKFEKPAMPTTLLKKPQPAPKPMLPAKHSFMCGSNFSSDEV
jgi:hypothetical protein